MESCHKHQWNDSLVEMQTASKDAWKQPQTEIFWIRASKFQTWNNFYIMVWNRLVNSQLSVHTPKHEGLTSVYLTVLYSVKWIAIYGLSQNADVPSFFDFLIPLNTAICGRFFQFLSYGGNSSSSMQILPNPAWGCPPHVTDPNREGQEPQGQHTIAGRTERCVWNGTL